MKITARMLQAKGACTDQVTLFRTLFPKGGTVTRAMCIKYAQDFDFEWAAWNLLSAPARAEYQRVQAPARAEYERVTDAARAEYERVQAPALAEYQRTMAAAFADAALKV